MTEHHIAFQAVNVPKLGSERRELLAVPGISNPEVPVLVDGDVVIQNSARIIEHLSRQSDGPSFGDPGYGISRVLPGLSFADAVPAVKTALASEGFGVLTEIDLRATMKKKLDIEFQNYVILGACNPPLAHQALTFAPAIGLLLPCNVVVTEEGGNTVVSAIDPSRMFEVVKREELAEIAGEVGDRLRRALAAIPT